MINPINDSSPDTASRYRIEDIRDVLQKCLGPVNSVVDTGGVALYSIWQHTVSPRGALVKKTRVAEPVHAQESGDTLCSAVCGATMGFDGQWPKIWGQQSHMFVVQRVTCKTIFIDAQIQLMKSFVKEDEGSWREFIHRTFFAPIAEFHRHYDTVIVCFDNYQNVPIFKSIEQSKRVSASAQTNTFKFKAGDVLPNKPYEQRIWVQALQNRSFKSNIISLITSMMAAEYAPPRRATTLVVDFVNSTRIDYQTHGKTRVILENMKPMGESDVKFMRYVPLFGDMCVDSIDSDVLLIAALFVSRTAYSGNIYVRRYKTRLPEAGTQGVKRKLNADSVQIPEPEKKKFQYEIINVKLLVEFLHTRMQGAAVPSTSPSPYPMNDDAPSTADSTLALHLGTCTPTKTLEPAHLTAMLSFMVLLCGCDYSKKLPRVGVKSLWDNFDVVIPAMLQCTSYSNNIFSVDTEMSINGLIASLYARVYTKHVKTWDTDPAGGMQAVLTMLHSSTLSEKTKNELPTHLSLNTTLRNIEWVINYWSIENGDPACPIDGTHGFALVENKIVYS